MAALIAQQGEYTLETVSPGGRARATSASRSIREVIPFDPGLCALIEVGAEPSTRIISFTVTEAGYYLDSQNRLDPATPICAPTWTMAATARSTARSPPSCASGCSAAVHR